ncbi:hypothetical protein Cfla_1653 [Cellulomonas flavigena DSM 20109]|uniref:Uncharacterized protein n=1 Tax=Cellulomonas flavigena (strain ATCC 482 / DSM 20109 / BCRC 11376 / JCM 18109 / NBRC 3775 / NCIMB 8073 / NRS 134) TaxID=446466 RepID=D5UDZ3_CELFN|nr:hypothetical protein Cfla_1653 [Cellulomonas flavigena DSM 20109]
MAEHRGPPEGMGAPTRAARAVRPSRVAAGPPATAVPREVTDPSALAGAACDRPRPAARVSAVRGRTAAPARSPTGGLPADAAAMTGERSMRRVATRVVVLPPPVVRPSGASTRPEGGGRPAGAPGAQQVADSAPDKVGATVDPGASGRGAPTVRVGAPSVRVRSRLGRAGVLVVVRPRTVVDLTAVDRCGMSVARCVTETVRSVSPAARMAAGPPVRAVALRSDVREAGDRPRPARRPGALAATARRSTIAGWTAPWVARLGTAATPVGRVGATRAVRSVEGGRRGALGGAPSARSAVRRARSAGPASRTRSCRTT